MYIYVHTYRELESPEVIFLVSQQDDDGSTLLLWAAEEVCLCIYTCTSKCICKYEYMHMYT
jgi:hypothetical protein